MSNNRVLWPAMVALLFICLRSESAYAENEQIAISQAATGRVMVRVTGTTSPCSNDSGPSDIMFFNVGSVVSIYGLVIHSCVPDPLHRIPYVRVVDVGLLPDGKYVATASYDLLPGTPGPFFVIVASTHFEIQAGQLVRVGNATAVPTLSYLASGLLGLLLIGTVLFRRPVVEDGGDCAVTLR